MKIKNVLIEMLAGAILLSACNESSEKNSRFFVSLHANYIHPSQNDLRFNDAAGGSMEFTVFSQDTPWMIDAVPEWVTVNPVSGSASATVAVSVPRNNQISPRMGIFTLRSAAPEWSYRRQMTVTQSGETPFLTLDKQAFSFGGQAASETVNVSSNFAWTISNLGNDWITILQGDSQMTVSVTANDTGTDRSGSVQIVLNNNAYATLTVTQLAAAVSLRSDPLDFEIGAGSYVLAIESEAPWDAVTYSEWIDISPDSGSAGRTEVAVTVTPNPDDEARDAYVYFRFRSSGLQIAEIPVHQDGIVLELSGSSEDFENLSSLGGEWTWFLRSNTDWNIVQVPDFLTVSPMSGSGSTSLAVTLKENASFDWLEGNFTVQRVGTGYEISRWMRQRGRTYQLSETWLECNDLAQDLYVDVETEGDWGLSNETDFFTPSPMSARGNCRITLSVSENTDYSERQGVVRFLLYGMSGYENGIAPVADIWVRQYGWQDKYHEMGKEIILPVAGGSVPVDIATNDGWTVAFASAASWIRIVGPATGKGGGNFQVAFDENPTVSARSVLVRITFEHMESVEFTLVQPGRSIRLGSDALYFFAKGGSSTVSVAADGPYSVQKTGGEWFTVDAHENNSFIVKAEPYEGDSERTGSIVVALTDQESGSCSVTLPVIQTTAAGFTREGFQADRDLNVGTGTGFSIRVQAYTTDRNWNGGSQASIGREGYGDDENWN